MLTLRTLLDHTYDATAEQLDAALQPIGAAEVFVAAEIVRARWRIERCEAVADPDHPEIDRLRRSAGLALRRNMAELRQLQADRHLKARLNLDLPGVAAVKDIVKIEMLQKRTQSSLSAAECESRILALFDKEETILRDAGCFS